MQPPEKKSVLTSPMPAFSTFFLTLMCCFIPCLLAPCTKAGDRGTFLTQTVSAASQYAIPDVLHHTKPSPSFHPIEASSLKPLECFSTP